MQQQVVIPEHIFELAEKAHNQSKESRETGRPSTACRALDDLLAAVTPFVAERLLPLSRSEIERHFGHDYAQGSYELARVVTERTGVAPRFAVDDLKRQWEADGRWDLGDVAITEEPDVYAPYRAELHVFEAEKRALWESMRVAEEAVRLAKEAAAAAVERTRIADRAASLGCSVELVSYVEYLERRISRVEDYLG